MWFGADFTADNHAVTRGDKLCISSSSVPARWGPISRGTAWCGYIFLIRAVGCGPIHNGTGGAVDGEQR